MNLLNILQLKICNKKRKKINQNQNNVFSCFIILIEYLRILMTLLFLLFRMFCSALLPLDQQPPQTQKTMLKTFQISKKKNNTSPCNHSVPKNFLSIELQHKNTMKKCKQVLGHCTEQIKQFNSSSLDGVNSDSKIYNAPHAELVNRTKLLLKIKNNHNSFVPGIIPNHNKFFNSKKFVRQKINYSLQNRSKNSLAKQKKCIFENLPSFEQQLPIQYPKRTQTPQSHQKRGSSSMQQRKPSQIIFNPQDNKNQSLLVNVSIMEKQQNIQRNKQKQDWILDYINQRLKKQQQKANTKIIYNQYYLRQNNSFLRDTTQSVEKFKPASKDQLKKSNQKNLLFQRKSQPYYQEINVAELHKSVNKQGKNYGKNSFARPNTTIQKQRPIPISVERIEEKLQPW